MERRGSVRRGTVKDTTKGGGQTSEPYTLQGPEVGTLERNGQELGSHCNGSRYELDHTCAVVKGIEIQGRRRGI